jgi:hypothetical protein
MMRHVVFCKIRKDLSDADITTVFEAIKGLEAKIGGILAITTGRDMSPEGLQKGFTHGFTVDFTDSAARDVYLPHPEHQKVGAMLVAAVEGGKEGLAVIDWEV